VRVLRLGASKVARRLFEIVTRVAAGEKIDVTRASPPVADIGPRRARVVSAERFRELMRSAPPVDDDFAEDVRSIRRSVGPPETAD
jgi:antitoxin (DNA-binding transcriptional repressor) of toxin-antitoxin stability system